MKRILVSTQQVRPTPGISCKAPICLALSASSACWAARSFGVELGLPRLRFRERWHCHHLAHLVAHALADLVEPHRPLAFRPVLRSETLWTPNVHKEPILGRGSQRRAFDIALAEYHRRHAELVRQQKVLWGFAMLQNQCSMVVVLGRTDRTGGVQLLHSGQAYSIARRHCGPVDRLRLP